MILDNDILVDLIREHPAAIAWLASLPELPAASGMAAMELVTGSQHAIELRHVQRFLSVYVLVWPTETDMRRAFNEYLPLRLQYGIGLLYSLIAATANGRGEELATFNGRHFRAVPGLIVVQPYTR